MGKVNSRGAFVALAIATLVGCSDGYTYCPLIEDGSARLVIHNGGSTGSDAACSVEAKITVNDAVPSANCSTEGADCVCQIFQSFGHFRVQVSRDGEELVSTEFDFPGSPTNGGCGVSPVAAQLTVPRA